MMDPGRKRTTPRETSAEAREALDPRAALDGERIVVAESKGDEGEGDRGEGEGDRSEGDRGEGDEGEGEGDRSEGDRGEGDRGEGSGSQGSGSQGERVPSRKDRPSLPTSHAGKDAKGTLRSPVRSPVRSPLRSTFGGRGTTPSLGSGYVSRRARKRLEVYALNAIMAASELAALRQHFAAAATDRGEAPAGNGSDFDVLPAHLRV
jgi:hypothetical protein